MASSAKTRIVRLDGGPPRDEATNSATRVLRYERAPTPASFRELFVRNYEAFRQVCTRHARAGVAVLAVDAYTSRMRGSLWLAAKPEVANAAIIGRHGKADLWLDDDPSLSLRHLALVLWPERSDGEVRFRLLDLRTQSAFVDEHGRQYESLEAEGPLFVRCGSYALFFIVTGDGIAWPDAASDGWACIPERVYLESEDAEPDRWQRKRAPAAPPRRRSPDVTEGGASWAETTMVRRLRGPVEVGTRLLAAGERPLGVLCITVGDAQQDLAIGQKAAHAGVLLGRYERCDGSGTRVLATEGISRVHLLVCSVDDCLYAIDTASTNGTQQEGDDASLHIVPLEPGQVLSLAGGVAKLRWFAAN